jgi:Helix-turn-helix domain
MKDNRIMNLPTLMTEDEVAEYLKCAPRTVRRYRKGGKLPVIGTYTKSSGHIVPLFASADVSAL